MTASGGQSPHNARMVLNGTLQIHPFRACATVSRATNRSVGFPVPKRVANLPDEDSVIRHVPWSKLFKDEDCNVLGFLPQAFELRPDEDALSVAWVEYYDDPATRVRDTIWGIRRARKVGAKSAFAVGNVGKIKETCLAAANVRVRVVPEPLERWPAHAAIRRLPHDDLALLEALASAAFVDLVSNQSVPLERGGAQQPEGDGSPQGGLKPTAPPE